MAKVRHWQEKFVLFSRPHNSPLGLHHKMGLLDHISGSHPWFYSWIALKTPQFKTLAIKFIFLL